MSTRPAPYQWPEADRLRMQRAMGVPDWVNLAWPDPRASLTRPWVVVINTDTGEIHPYPFQPAAALAKHHAAVLPAGQITGTEPDIDAVQEIPNGWVLGPYFVPRMDREEMAAWANRLYDAAQEAIWAEIRAANDQRRADPDGTTQHAQQIAA